MYRWRGIYFDGVTAARHEVTFGTTAEGIAFALPDGTARAWTSREYDLRVAPGRRHMRFERKAGRGEAIHVDDPQAIGALLSRQSLGTWRTSRLAVLAAVCIATVAGLYFAVPVLTDGVVRLMPRPVEERLGRAVVAGLVPSDAALDLNERAQPLLDRLFVAADPQWTYRVTWQRTHQVNAFAAPGGQIVVYCGLVQAMRSPDELAAILAHEVTHVSERHSTRNLVRTLGARLLLSLVGGADVLVDTAAMLGALHYMRGDEEEADLKGQELLTRAGIDPGAMAKAFERLERDSVVIATYLSSHPSTEERRKRAEEFARRHTAAGYRPAIGDAQWRELRAACTTR